MERTVYATLTVHHLEKESVSNVYTLVSYLGLNSAIVLKRVSL